MSNKPSYFSRSPQVLLIVLACVLAGANATRADLNDGLIAYWSFDEGSGGTAYDESGNGNDATIHGASWSEGVAGPALSFDGTDDYAERLYDPDFTPGLDSWTVTAWVRSTGMAMSGKIVDWYRCGANPHCDSEDAAEYRLCVSSSATAIWHLRDDAGSVKTVAGTTDLADGAWHSLVGVADRDVSECRLYVDGQLVDSVPSLLGSLSDGDVPVPLEIGRIFRTGWGVPSGYFHGVIDEVRIYNRALSPAEVLDLYWSTTHPDPQDDTTHGAQSDVSGTSDDPVNTATGSFFHQETDLSIPSRGVPLTFTRFYNSKAAAPGRKTAKSKQAPPQRKTATSQPASTNNGESSGPEAKKHNESPATKDHEQTAGSSQPQQKEEGK
ncbi:MAG: LamG domain-containing protein [Phycisphaerae bacterium]|nr:LamG domain-containing protein [Phycisphaerae bacterium]